MPSKTDQKFGGDFAPGPVRDPRAAAKERAQREADRRLKARLEAVRPK